MMWGLFIRRVPNCAAPVSVITGVVVSSCIVGLPKLLGTAPWTYQEQISTMFAASTLAFFGARFLYRGDDPEVVAREREFFSNRDRPVDFAAEIGAGNDGRQMRIIGVFAFAMGAAMLLLLIPASSAGHWGKIASISGTTAAVGALLLYLGYRRKGTP
jgi:VIT1/CCC1 family predicted Fe2+/Mn2+ transporter